MVTNVTASPYFSPGFGTSAAKGGQMLGFSRIGHRRRSGATWGITIREKHDRWPESGSAANTRREVRAIPHF